MVNAITPEMDKIFFEEIMGIEFIVHDPEEFMAHCDFLDNENVNYISKVPSESRNYYIIMVV